MNTLSRIALTISAIALALGLTASPAAADDSPQTGKAGATTSGLAAIPAAAQEKPGTPKVKTLIFGEGSDVEGGVVGPDGETVGVAGTLIHSNLIRVRQHFIPEIFKSAENL
jgi:hypothetical protein